MKFNFKKIASVLTSTVMLSSTVAFAAAANFPQPFVKDGTGSYAIVVGAGAGDATAAQNINAYLSGMVTTDTNNTDITIEGGEFYSLDKSSNRLNLGSALNSVVSTLNSDKLPTVLADGIYTDKDTDENYEQKVTLFNPASLTQFADSEVDSDEKPVIGYDISTGTDVLNYTLSFTDTPKNASMADTDINMLGRDYYISQVDDTSSGLQLTLLDKANGATVYSDEPVSVTVGNEKYDVELVSVDGTNEKATLMVNGKKLDSITLGNSKKIADNTYISITDLKEAQRESDKHFVEFSIGTGKIVLTNGENVEVNDDTVDSLTSYISTTSNQVDSITLAWRTSEETYLVPGKELVLPGFEALKLSMTGFQTGDGETLNVKNSGNDYMQLENVELSDGSVDIPLLYANDSTYIGLGKSASNKLVTSGGLNITLNEDEKSRFVVTYEQGDTWDSYYLELSSVSKSNDKNSTKIKNLANDKVYEFTNGDSTADDTDIGSNINLAVVGDEKTNNAHIIASALGSGNVYLDRIVTKAGLQILLPVNNGTAVAAGNHANITANGVTSWRMDMKEGDEDNNVASGSAFNLTLNINTDGPQVSSVSPSGLSVDSSSDDTVSRVVGDHASKVVLMDDNQNTAAVTYYKDEAYANVYVTEATTTTSSSSSAGTMVVTDADVENVKSKNLIVVGGTCVNKVAAKVLGVDDKYPVCGDAWQTLTTVGADEFLIQTIASPYTSGKVAMLVAGYNQADTTKAASALESKTDIDTTAGKKYIQKAGSVLTGV